MSAYVLILLDTQKEYTTQGRSFYLNDIASSLNACQRLLVCAREMGWPVWHVRHQQNTEPFLAGSDYAEFVPGFEPRADEEVIVKHQLSAFTQTEFATLAQAAQQSGQQMILAGFSGTMCCLSTAVDAMHRGIKMLWVADASLSRASAIASEAEVHQHLTEIMRIYAHVTTVDTLLRQVRPATA